MGWSDNDNNYLYFIDIKRERKLNKTLSLNIIWSANEIVYCI